MIRRNLNPGRLLYSCALVSAAMLWQGCAPAKNVTINSTPDKAHLMFFRVGTGGDETPVNPGGDDTVATTSVNLDFSNPVHYRVEAHRALCMPSVDTEIRLDDQMTYNIALTQYKQDVNALINTPVKVGDIWQIKPTPVHTVATKETNEPVSAYIDQPVMVTKNKSADVDFPGFDTSSTTALIVYEQLQPDSSSANGYSSKLYALPLTPGESPKLLTLGRKQQRCPAFDFSGDMVIFNSNDDSRTDSPFEFKVADNGSTITHLEHEPDTLEYSFTVGKDNIAFASYSANATEPSIEAASRDGSGQTQRASGMSPQLSPDGSLIVYSHKPEGGGKLRICTVNTRGPIITHEMAQNDETDCFDPHWSPDGSMIVYCSPSRGKDLPDDQKKEPNPKYHDAESEHSFLWIVSANGQHSLRLTKNESFDGDPVFDRNGRTVYFRSNRGGMWNIWKLNLTDATFAELKVIPPAQ